ncbi:EXPERA domain-containing protein [Trichoderma simmonsii]|uniref:EXPERA domain-containing protein n=1 Tax=Trichoderma simmonsii TaxID=1491479 RepID=A0A8G0LGY2_9HYPO|nr:EXPERA domain-containing protein [Trichoderma simmonsii]
MDHPYYPLGVSIPNYRPNDLPLFLSLPVFGALIGSIVVPAYLLAGSGAGSRRRVRTIDRFAASWFALCGFLHIAFEGYYILHRTSISSKNTLFAQLWKEYTLSDSRYLTSDIFTVCVETITVFAWGPLSLIAVLCICTNHPSRHLFQIVVCVAHLYGVALYYATNWAEQRFHGVSYSRPEFLYFWIYYVGFNAPWAIVPFCEWPAPCGEASNLTDP